MMGTAKYTRLHNVGQEHYNERADCSVIAIALLLDVSYGKAHAALGRAGRKPRGRTVREMLHTAIDELAVGKKAVTTAFPKGEQFTMAKAKDNLDGRRLLFTRGHVACMIDGIVHDWTQGRRHKVLATLQLEEMHHA